MLGWAAKRSGSILSPQKLQILPGSILRQGVLVCAGSLLIGDTEEWGVYKGNPAKLVKKIKKDKIIANSEKLLYEFQYNN